MGSMFRSEEMALAQFFIQPEAAYLTISELGEKGIVQFRDLNDEVSAFQRKFAAEVKRCNEMERKLRTMKAEVKKDELLIVEVLELPKAPTPREIINLEAHIEKSEGDIKVLTENSISLKTNFQELQQFLYVLEKIDSFISYRGDPLKTSHAAEDDYTEEGQLGFIAGIINRDRVPAFERMLWRISRGNVFLRQVEIENQLEDPSTGNPIQKIVFGAFFQGELLKNRVKKVCEGFHASLYSFPDSVEQRKEMISQLKTKLEDLTLVLNQTEEHKRRVLYGVAKEIENWIIMVKKMKSIYYTLNLFSMDVSENCLIGEGWLPVSDVETVRTTLSFGSGASGSSISSFVNVINTTDNPPTFNRTNKFTQVFQNLIDSYGVASYREVNPALYTIITFPFLFAVMFGDMGHGIILSLFGWYMVRNEEKIIAAKSRSEFANIFFSGRYIILLMGLFSMYTGFVYNDVFSKSMNMFGSKWTIYYNESTVLTNEYLDLDPGVDYDQTPYFMGLDPVWQLAQNKIIFQNSFKMKLSIILGVVHMIFGVCMGVVNHIHFRKYASIVLEFLPQLVFLMALFFWLVTMMFLKWIIYNPASEDIALRPGCAPSILIYFINMMLFSEEEVKPNCRAYMFDQQKILQIVLVVIGLICIPVMLLGKPLYAMQTRKYKRRHGHLDEEEEEISEIFIHQAIHTIEYFLSTVSHTASYLRLWALSLAHSQLSEVLWNRVLRFALKIDGYVAAIILAYFFIVWAFFTVSILVTMEGLSAFLHTLRLHWVEFISKFYNGDGYLFEPFSFTAMFEKEEENIE